MNESFHFHVTGAYRALAAGNAHGSAALLRLALGVASRMQDDARKGLCLRILKWLKQAVSR